MYTATNSAVPGLPARRKGYRMGPREPPVDQSTNYSSRASDQAFHDAAKHVWLFGPV
ncbi:hypothetical protein [Alloactinosynnema sp. L-07]|nr:hypothetical protein [Alloactinosynnema sp. L-07]